MKKSSIVIAILLLFSLPIHAKKSRFVSMGPSVTESLYAVGLGDQVVGASKYCNYPAVVESLPRVGTSFSPNIERLVALAPDMVFSQALADLSFEQKMRALKLKVTTLGFNTYEEILKSLDQLIKIAKKKKGLKIVNDIRKEEALLKKLKLSGQGLVVIEAKVKLSKLSELMIAGGDSYLGDIIRMTGLEVKSSSKSYYYYSLEKLLLSPPDFIYLIRLKKNERKLLIDFLKERGLEKTKVIALNQDYSNIPGPRISLLMREIYESHRN